MLRLIMAVAIAASIPTGASAQMVSCSNVHRPECSKSPFAPSGEGYRGGPYAYDYEYGYPPPTYYRRGGGYYRPMPYGPYGGYGPYGPYAPYGYWGAPGY
jgi:hypothetical protein